MSDYDPQNTKSGLLLVILALTIAASLVVGLLVLAEKF